MGQQEQEQDYYVSGLDVRRPYGVRRYVLVAGPYATHGAARAALPRVRRIVTDLDPTGADHAAWGTCSLPRGTAGPGKLNARGLLD